MAGAAAGASLALPGTAGASRTSSIDPFTLGVASGDPTPSGVVLWTRLATDPLADDGRGGMGDATVDVEWEIAADERFRKIVRRGAERAVPDFGHSVHVELDGLEPGREYWYRFKSGSHVSPAGRTLTAPKDSVTGSLAMALVSCSMFEHGWFTAYRHLAADHPDLVLHLGDYQYEYAADVYQVPSGNIRKHLGPETETLAGYRQRLAQYKTDPDLQAARAVAPWLVVFDDHEVDNNWADEVYEKPEIPQPNFMARREAAFQAYYENQPLRRASLLSGPDIQLYRRVRWGALANFHMMDTRQYRDDQACGDGWKVCEDRLLPERSLPGMEQEQWVNDGFRASGAVWDILGQQVFFAQRRHPDEAERMSMDAWDGYKPSRDRILKAWQDAGKRNLVVLTGDVHAHWASNIKADFDDQDSASLGAELVCSSITSGGDGKDLSLPDDPYLKANPHIKFHNTHRGYVITKITDSKITADFKGVDIVSQKDHPLSTKATFELPEGHHELVPKFVKKHDRNKPHLKNDEIVKETHRLERN